MDDIERQALRDTQEESRSNIPRPDASFLQAAPPEPPSRPYLPVLIAVALLISVGLVLVIATPCMMFQLRTVPTIGMDALRMECKATADGSCVCSTPEKAGCYRSCQADETSQTEPTCQMLCDTD